MKKTNVTKYKRTHRWNTTSYCLGFWKDVDLQDSQASRNNELQFLHKVLSNALPGFSKDFTLGWENRLWSWTCVAGNGQNFTSARKWRGFCWDQLESSSSPLKFSLDKPLKKFEKVVSGRAFHVVTSLKRWGDYYILSLWRNGEEVVKKRRN